MLVEICLFIALVIAYYVAKDRKPKGMPPGPWEIPFLGNQPPISVEYIMQLRQRYGDVVTTRMANMRSVLLFDYQLAKEAMAAPELADRPSFLQQFSLDERGLGGIIAASGPQWQHDRRFLLRNLRNLGMGKSSLEDAIHLEVEALVEELRANCGRTLTETPHSFRTATLNIVWQMVSGKRYDLNSKEVIAIFEASNKLMKELSTLAQIFFILPKSVQNLCPRSIQDSVFMLKQVEDFVEQMKCIVSKHVDEGEEKLKNGTDGDDVISEYLREMKKYEHDKDSRFWRGSLLQSVADLFNAGADTVFNMLRWTVYFMLKYPDLLKEMQEEIDRVTPRGQLVSWAHREDLPLIEAFTVEALRYATLVTMNVPRCASRDTKIGGYFIPKGTIVNAVNYAIHHDPAHWDAPGDFNPRRFISEDGKFNAPKEAFFAFGSGRRQCLGETLARMEYFLLSAALIQNFTVRVPEGGEFDASVDDSTGMRLPRDQPLIFDFRG